MSYKKHLWNMWDKFNANNCMGLAAEMGYWFLFALFPFLIFLIAMSSFLPFAKDPANTLLALKRLLPDSIYESIAATVLNLQIQPNGWIAAGTLLLALWSASTAVYTVMGTLNRVYEVEETRPFWKLRLIALMMTIILIVVYNLAFGLLVLEPVLSALVARLVGYDQTIHLIFSIIRIGIVIATMVGAFSLIYSFAPNIHGKERVPLPGAIVAMLGWFAISRTFSYYVQNFADYNRFYGTLGAVIALMTWLYLISLMILIGGLLNSELNPIPRPEPDCKEPPPNPIEQAKQARSDP